MTGLYVLLIATAWIALAAAIAYGLTSRVGAMPLRLLGAFVLFAMLLPLPLVDEIVGKGQFERLCKANTTIQVERASATGKTVYLAKIQSVAIKDAWVPVVMKLWRYVDASTGETVVSYNTLDAGGGRLVQMFGFSEGRTPLIFSSSFCGPKDRPAGFQGFEALGIKYIEPPSTGELK